MTNKIKLIIVLFILGTILSITGSLLYSFLSTGQIEIAAANKDDVISITKLRASPSKTYNKQANGSLSVRVVAGTYSVGVQNKAKFASMQTVTLKARQRQKLKITVSAPGNIELVSNTGVSDLIAAQNKLRYLNLNDHALYEINDQNHQTSLGSAYSFQGLQWADISFGVGLDQDGKLDLVQNSYITQVALPFNPTKLLSFAVSPNKDVYVTDGKALYLGHSAQNFKAIYTSPKTISLSVAGLHSVLGREYIAGSTKEGSSQLLVVDSTGGSFRTALEAYDAAWSPDGRYVVISSSGQGTVLDARLKLVIPLPAGIGAPTWLDSTTLFYSTAEGVWRFNIQTGLANLVATSQQPVQFGRLFISQDGAYAYVVTQNVAGDNSFSLGRFGLKSQPASQSAAKLGIILPNTVNGCSLDYIDFVGVTITAHGAAGNAQSCIQSAQDYVRTYQVDSSGISFGFEPNN